MIDSEDLMEVDRIVDELIEKTFEIAEDKSEKIKNIQIYHKMLMKALEEIFHFYNMPKPCTDFEYVIEAWKRDEPALPSTPDSLSSPLKLYINESN